MSDHQPDSHAAITRQGTRDLICGVDRGLIEDFLRLIQNNYKEADKATFFLEQRTGVVNVQGIANVRDVLSHLATLLSPDTPTEKKAAQLANAEEHLRRAIIEPYEVALNELLIKVNEFYFNYKRYLLPVKNKHLILASAPNEVSIDASLREIAALYSQGRKGKGKNIWTPEWEQGITGFIEAYENLSSLYADLEKHWNDYEQIARDKKSTLLGTWGIIAEGIAFILEGVLKISRESLIQV